MIRHFKWSNISILLFFIDVHHSLAFDEYAKEFGEVIFVNILFRHGDRTPINSYPTDPYQNDTFWPEGYGQLTNLGKLQEYELGQWLRNRYSHLVSTYNKDKIYVQSTDVDRTLMSAECNLAGLFPPSESEKWDVNMTWQPVPVHTVPEHLDKVLAAKMPCPKYKKEFEKVMKSPEIEALNNKYKDLYDYVSKHSGKVVKNVSELEFLYDVLLIENNNNLTLPSWTKPVFPIPMEEASRWSFALDTWTKELGRLKVGPLIGEMVQHLKQKHNKEMDPDRNLWYYSAHDSTVANLLNTLGVFELHNPPYTATVLLELRLKDNFPFVTLFYRNSTSHEPYLLTIPRCNSACPLDQFISLTQELIPENWELECHSHYFFDLTSDLPYNSIAIFAMITSALLIFLLITSMSFYWQKRKPKHWYHKLRMDAI